MIENIAGSDLWELEHLVSFDLRFVVNKLQMFQNSIHIFYSLKSLERMKRTSGVNRWDGSMKEGGGVEKNRENLKQATETRLLT